MRNTDKTHGACPILAEGEVQAYLLDGSAPESALYLAVPTGKIVRRRGFWLTPSSIFHHGTTCFLISTDVYAMNTDELENERQQVFCYSTQDLKTFYIGWINDCDLVESRILRPLIDDLFPDLNVDQLRYIGRVIATT
ncbi:MULTISPECIES: hypothetical protein [Pseudomonas syringae group]|nr:MULTISPECIES: hypothetical protein [Pseudomonas syringae group]MDH4602503.1 hypothetical protein [Pseudomonas syringae pv. papulans]